MNCPHCHAANSEDSRFCGVCGKATSATEPASGSYAQSFEAPSLVGKEIAGRYRIQAKLGEGGMGAVYKAEQISLKRTVAVKLLRPDVAGSALLLRRFNAEAEAVAKLSHPNTVNIYDFGQDTDGSLFIAMEFIEGRSLRGLVQAEAPLPLRRALTIAGQVAASLADAHSHSIIHRDLKPDNVMLQDRGRARDVARVLDFGIAKLRDDSRATQQAMTQAGDMLGTPQYMAPEQIRAEQIDGRTDVYALGCMIYEMLTARQPFEGPTIMALLSKHLTEMPPPPSQRRPELGIPPQIDELVMAAMAKDPRQRPATMELFGEQIAAVLATLPGGPTTNVSAVVAVPQLPVNTPTPSGQGGYGQPGYHPPTPPPMGYAATAPIGGGPGYAPTPAPIGGGPGYAPTTPVGPGYAPPQPAYNSGYPAPTPPPASYPRPPEARPGGGSNTLLWVVIALVAIGAAGAGIYFATRPSPKTQPIAEHDGSDGSDDKPAPGDDPLDEIVEKIKSIKDEMCACIDASCADRVKGEMTAVSQTVNKAAVASKEPGPKVKEIADLMTQYSACLTKIATADVPAKPDPWAGSGDHTGDHPAEPDGDDEPDEPEVQVPKPRPPPPPPRSLNQQIDDLAARSCRCRDAACARRVVNDLAAFLRRNKYAQGGDEARARRAGEQLAKCAVNAGMPADELMSILQGI